ncbi:MAG: hypothetical protein M1127_03615 [Patescibacteria group bacterium]|nr:hypothetical protein [Patescibacteria group bacterium]
MDCIAIIKKSWGLVEKILTGRETVESLDRIKVEKIDFTKIQKGGVDIKEILSKL